MENRNRNENKKTNTNANRVRNIHNRVLKTNAKKH